MLEIPLAEGDAEDVLAGRFQVSPVAVLDTLPIRLPDHVAADQPGKPGGAGTDRQVSGDVRARANQFEEREATLRERFAQAGEQ